MGENFKSFNGSGAIEKKNKRREALRLELEEKKDKKDKIVFRSEVEEDRRPAPEKEVAESLRKANLEGRGIGESISPEDIEEMRTEESGAEKEGAENYEEIIKSLKSKEDIISFLSNIDGIRGTSNPEKIYKSKDLKEGVELIFSMDATVFFNHIPRTDGLRAKIEEIYKKEKENKKEKEQSVEKSDSKDDIEMAVGAVTTQEKSKDVAKDDLGREMHGVIEVKEENESKEDKELERLMSEVEKARKVYAKKDYETTNTVNQIKKIFGRFINSNLETSKKEDYSYNQYQEKLKDLLVYQVEKIKKETSESGNDAEIIELMKFYNQDEKLNLFAERTNARAEAWEEKYGKAPGYLAEKGGKFINWYRKVGWKKKMIFSGALLGIGIAGSMTGAASVVGAVGVAKILQRGVSGVMAGTGVSGMVESLHRKKEEKKAQKNRENIKEDLDISESYEEKYETLMQKMQEEIAGYEKDLKTEKSKATRRKLFGATAGVLVGGGWTGEAIRNVSDATGFTEALNVAKKFWLEKAGDSETLNAVKNFVSEKINSGDKSLKDNKVGKATSSDVQESSVAKDRIVAEETGETAVGAQESTGGTEIIIPKGGSFEGEIIKQLVTNGMAKEDAGKMAHKMYVDYLENFSDPSSKNYNIIQPGAKITLGEDSSGKPMILDFEDGLKVAPRGDLKINSAIESDTEVDTAKAENSLVDKKNADISTEKNSVAEKVAKTEVIGDKVANNSDTKPLTEAEALSKAISEDLEKDSRIKSSDLKVIATDNSSTEEDVLSQAISEDLEGRSTTVKDSAEALNVKKEDVSVKSEEVGIEKNEITLSPEGMNFQAKAFGELEKYLSKHQLSEYYDKKRDGNYNIWRAQHFKQRRMNDFISKVLRRPEWFDVSYDEKSKSIIFKDKGTNSILKYFEKDGKSSLIMEIEEKEDFAKRAVSNLKKSLNIQDSNVDDEKLKEALERLEDTKESSVVKRIIENPQNFETVYNPDSHSITFTDKETGNVLNYSERGGQGTFFVEGERVVSSKSRELFDKVYKVNGSSEEKLKTIAKMMSLDDIRRWKVIKDLKFSDVKIGEKLNYNLVDRIKLVEKQFVGVFGEKAKHKEGETISKWIVRVTKMIELSKSAK